VFFWHFWRFLAFFGVFCYFLVFLVFWREIIFKKDEKTTKNYEKNTEKI
jgi:hypothetical protein